jgi:hypothetical protein
LFTLKHARFQADQNQAISMVSYYASSSEPAQVRGKTVYIQYSNRQEITNNKGTGDSSGNVLLVTFEGVQPNDVTIEVIHLVSLYLCLNVFTYLPEQLSASLGPSKCSFSCKTSLLFFQKKNHVCA